MNIDELAKLLTIAQLPAYIERLEQHLQTLIEQSDNLKKPSLKLLKSGGKRLRPTLVIAIMVSQDKAIDDSVLSAAAAIELIHLASLAHDDLLDDAKLRRAQPTINAGAGANAAVLVGDYLLALAGAQAATVSKEIAYIIADTTAVMCDGQAQEIFSTKIDSKTYRNISRKKTASLFAAACRIGALCAQMDEINIDRLASYGELFGTAFQIIDDIVDQDLKAISLSEALSEIRQYNSKAANIVKASGGNLEVIDGLAKLPNFYLEWVLPKPKTAIV
jgi:heptaprenyl diphosphate synthase